MMLSEAQRFQLLDMLETAGLESVLTAVGLGGAQYVDDDMIAQGFVDSLNVASLLLNLDRERSRNREGS